MVDLWRLAVEHANREAVANLASEGTALESARAELVQETESWKTRLMAADAEKAQAKVALELTERARQELETHLRNSEALCTDLGLRRDRLQEIGDRQALEIKELRVLLEERDGEHRRDREQRESHLRNVENRAHQEVDRARLDAKQWQHRYDTLERAHQVALDTLQKKRDLLRDQLRKADSEAARAAGVVSALEKVVANSRTSMPQQSKAKTGVTGDATAKRRRKSPVRSKKKTP